MENSNAIGVNYKGGGRIDFYVSIVVPIYNVEEYLPKCLDTIIAQSFEDIDIVLIDDGSPDGSGKICDEYAERDDRIRVFHIPNGGVAAARELGVKNALGEWIVFVDPDDYMPLDAVETLISVVDDEIDVVDGRYSAIAKGRICRFGNDSGAIIRLNNHEYIKELFEAKVNIAPWGKLFRKLLFTEDSFPRLKRTEDYMMNIELSSRVRSCVKIDRAVYCYLTDRDTSTVNSLAKSRDIKREKEIDLVLRSIMKNNGLFETYQANITKFSLREIKRAIRVNVRFSTDDDWMRLIVKEAWEMNRNVERLTFDELLTTLSLSHSFMQRVQYGLWILSLKYLTAKTKIAHIFSKR